LESLALFAHRECRTSEPPLPSQMNGFPPWAACRQEVLAQQGPANRAMRAGTPFQEFQEHQAFQAFQEIATHFKSVSRDSKSHQEFQEHVSRALETLETPGAHRQASKITRSAPAWVSKSFQEFQEHQEFQAFQEIATHFKSVSRDSKIYQEYQ